MLITNEVKIRIKIRKNTHQKQEEMRIKHEKKMRNKNGEKIRIKNWEKISSKGERIELSNI